jgi:hypothetical protein
MSDTVIGDATATVRSAIHIYQKSVRAAAILLGIGGLVGLAGLILGGSAVATATRKGRFRTNPAPRCAIGDDSVDPSAGSAPGDRHPPPRQPVPRKY